MGNFKLGDIVGLFLISLIYAYDLRDYLYILVQKNARKKIFALA